MKQIYFTVKDRLEGASTVERIAACAPAKHQAAVHPRRGDAGKVYFAQIGQLVKIGYSTNVSQRMKDIRATLIHAYPGSLRDERAAHLRFGAQYERGELFRPEGELADFLVSVAGVSVLARFREAG
jgi:hypothetical protein